MVINALENWFNRTCTRVVAVGSKYGVRRKLPFRKEEYLDIDGILPKNPFQGSVYGHPGLDKAPSKIQWWNRAETIYKFALSDDLPRVIEAYHKLGCYVPPEEITLPVPEVIDDIQMELAQYKLQARQPEGDI